MKALFLVGGSGTRLRPFTHYLPKPMMPIMGRPLLERTCERLQEVGIRQIVMNPCYMPNIIMRHFKDGAQMGLEVRYEIETEPLGTGGAIKNTGHHYNESFFVFNADILHDVNLAEMMAFHKKMRADVTIAAAWVEDPTPYGVIETTDDGLILDFKEKPELSEVGSQTINAGIYIFEPQVLDSIPQGVPVSVEREVFPALLEAGRPLAAFKAGGYWLNIGTPEKYVQAHRDIFAGDCQLGEADFRLCANHIDPTAQVDTNVLCDNTHFVGRGASVGSHCILGNGVVVGDNVEVAHNCYLEDAIIWPGAYIPAGSLLRDCVVTEQDGRLLRFPYESLGIQKKGQHTTNERQQEQGFTSQHLSAPRVRYRHLYPGYPAGAEKERGAAPQGGGHPPG